MAVTFTPNIALAKFTEAELADNWINGSELCEDNNLILIDKMEIDLVTYTPVLNSSGSSPTLGAGTIRGEYQNIQGFIVGTFVVEFGAGCTVGTGDYGVSLPFPGDATFHSITGAGTAPGNASCIGEGYVRDDSANATCGSVALDIVDIGGNSYARLITETYPGKTQRTFGPNMPFTLANLDKWTGSFFYKKA